MMDRDTSFYGMLEAQAGDVAETACLLYTMATDAGQCALCLPTLKKCVMATGERSRRLACLPIVEPGVPLSHADRVILLAEIGQIIDAIGETATQLSLELSLEISLEQERRPPTSIRHDFDSLACLFVAVVQETGGLLLHIPQHFCHARLHHIVAGICALHQNATRTFLRAITLLEQERELDPILRRIWRTATERLVEMIDRCANLAIFVERLAPVCLLPSTRF